MAACGVAGAEDQAAGFPGSSDMLVAWAAPMAVAAARVARLATVSVAVASMHGTARRQRGTLTYQRPLTSSRDPEGGRARTSSPNLFCKLRGETPTLFVNFDGETRLLGPRSPVRTFSQKAGWPCPWLEPYSYIYMVTVQYVIAFDLLRRDTRFTTYIRHKVLQGPLDRTGRRKP